MIDKNFVFVKPLNEERYDTESAIAYIKRYPNENIAMSLEWGDVIISKTEIDAGYNFVNLPVWQYLSDDWQLVVPDTDRMGKTAEVRDFMMNEVPGFKLDSRFYEPYEMDIDDWFNRLNE